MPNDSSSAIRRLIDAGADITGGLAGSAAGFLIAGPTGAFIGAAASGVVKHTLSVLALDVVERTISEREKARVGATITFAAAKIQEKLAAGQKLREDGFFDGDPAASGRSPADEIAEGVILAAQREHQEKKLKFYGNLLANLAFDTSIDRGYANFLLRLGEDLTYRQLCLVMLFFNKEHISGPGFRKTNYIVGGDAVKKVQLPPGSVPVLYEIFDLYSRGLMSAGGEALLSLPDITPAKMNVQGAGGLLYILMELDKLDLADVNALIPVLEA